jgi:predicted dehydrogenase
MSKKVFKVGVVGCGGIANGKHLPALKKRPNVEITYFCDIIPERAEKARDEYGTEDAKVCTDYKELINDPDLDVVHVLTPNREHAPITIAALEAGKHVLCEKPMAKTVEDAEAMLEAAKRTGKTLSIAYQNRYREDSMYLKTMCEEGDLGEIYYARALALRRRAVPTWGVFLDAEAQGGGPLIDIATHALDLTLWLMDNYEVDYVVGNSYRKLADRKNAANRFGPWDPEEFTVEDSAFGFVTMKNGATISIESSWAINLADYQEARCILAGTEAGADMKGGLRINGEKNGREYLWEPNLTSGGVDFYEGSGNESAADRECRMFYDALEAGESPLVLPEQALQVTRILDAVYKSSETRKPVFFDELYS